MAKIAIIVVSLVVCMGVGIFREEYMDCLFLIVMVQFLEREP